MYTALIGYVCLFVLGLVQALRPRQSYGLLKASWKQDVLWVLGNDQLSPRLLAWMQFAPSDWIEAHAPVLLDLTRKPALLQFLVGAVVVDFSRYWVHRLSHRIPILWELHKAHHSSTELTAISTYRGGFFDSLLIDFFAIGPLHLVGIRPGVLAALMAALTAHGILLHSNLDAGANWYRLGLGTPNFHRWHHAKESHDPGGQNFGAIVLLWDRLFGSLYTRETPPAALGFEGQERFPTGYLARFFYPLSLPRVRALGPQES